MTKIQWTDETWNPVVGCSKVHTGCTHCFAEVMAARPLPAFVGRHNLTVTDGRWNGRIVEQSDRLLLPLSWKKPRRVFVTSMSDIGHTGLNDNTKAIIYGTMILCPHHTFQNLTKRPQEIERFKREWTPSLCIGAAQEFYPARQIHPPNWTVKWSDVPNIHEYVSVSDQATADEYIPQLLRVPAAVRGVSLEPMVGAVDLSEWLSPPERSGTSYGGWSEMIGGDSLIDHVIVGGESGRKARPCDVEWIRPVVEQCRDAGVPVFVKQFGSNAYGDWHSTLSDPKGGDPSEWPEDLRVRMHVGEGW